MFLLFLRVPDVEKKVPQANNKSYVKSEKNVVHNQYMDSL